MSTLKPKIAFVDSEIGAAIKQDLHHMVLDNAFNTDSSYSANGGLYPDNLIPFVDKHMNYLNTHPALDPQQYMANLRLVTRIR